MIDFFNRLMSSDGSPAIGFKIGPPIEFPEEFLPGGLSKPFGSFALHSAKQLSTSKDCSAFIYSRQRDIYPSGSSASKYGSQNTSISDEELASACLSKAKTLRHPNLLRLIEAKENTAGIFLFTENCCPLISMDADSIGDPSYGISQIFCALGFLHKECRLTHGLVNPMSIFVTPSGDWKLFGFECTQSSSTTYNALLARVRDHPAWRNGWNPPSADLWQNLCVGSTSLDRWGLAGLICWVSVCKAQKGSLNVANEEQMEFRPEKLLSHLDCSSKSLVQDLLNHSLQLSLGNMVHTHPYFTEKLSVKVMNFLSNVHFKPLPERFSFYRALPEYIDEISPKPTYGLIMIELIKILELDQEHGSQLLICLFNLLNGLSSAQVKEMFMPMVIREFKNLDRTRRLVLLKHIHTIENFLDTAVADAIFPHLSAGFTDASPAIREASIQALVHVISHLRHRQVAQVVKFLQGLQSDEEAIIRINAAICFTKCSKVFIKNGFSKEILNSLEIGLKESAASFRESVLKGLSLIFTHFRVVDITRRIMPIVCACLVDQNFEVRGTALQTLEIIMKELKPIVTRQGPPADDSLAETFTSDFGSANLLGSVSNAALLLGKKAIGMYGNQAEQPEPPAFNFVSKTAINPINIDTFLQQQPLFAIGPQKKPTEPYDIRLDQFLSEYSPGHDVSGYRGNKKSENSDDITGESQCSGVFPYDIRTKETSHVVASFDPKPVRAASSAFAIEENRPSTIYSNAKHKIPPTHSSVSAPQQNGETPEMPFTHQIGMQLPKGVCDIGSTLSLTRKSASLNIDAELKAALTGNKIT